MKAFVSSLLARVGVQLGKRVDRDLARATALHAVQTTAAYVNEHMNSVQSCTTRLAVHDEALRHVDAGLVLEFGVFQGNTIRHIAHTLPARAVHGFDSFEGLPEAWQDGVGAGHFKVDGLPQVPSNVTLHKGWFDDTLAEFVKTLAPDDRIAYLHVDCDLYSSTRTIFELIGDRISVGTVIVFDEYFNYPGWQWGEFLAFEEFLERSGLTYEYLTYNRLQEQAAVRITGPRS